MRLSIVIPTFNRREELARCLRSIRAQHDAPCEVIVVDDCSFESVEDLLSPPDEIVLRNEFNYGPAYSRNRGVLHARGDLLVFMDSDVVLRPGALATAIMLMDQHEDIGILGGSGPPTADESDVQYIKAKFCDRWGRNVKRQITAGDRVEFTDCDHLESAFLVVRKTLFQEVGGFDPYWFYMGEDRELCLRVKMSGERVVACWPTRAIHFERNSPLKDTKPFWRFLVRRYLEVALKLGGRRGGLRWLVGNWRSLPRLGIGTIYTVLAQHEALQKRCACNFLSEAALAEYRRSALARARKPA